MTKRKKQLKQVNKSVMKQMLNFNVPEMLPNYRETRKEKRLRMRKMGLI